jgi:hypothetical protein
MHIELIRLPYLKILRVFVFTLFLATIFGTIIHEAGHCLTAVALGGRIKMIRMIPGIEIYPQVKFVGWDFSTFGGCSTTGVKSQVGKGFGHFMGSGSTLIVAYLLLLASRFIKQKWICIMLLLQALIYAWDIISYSVFPLFGLRHWLIIGGLYPEPLRGAITMGCPQAVYFVCLLMHLVVFHIVLIGIVRKREFHKVVLSNKLNQATPNRCANEVA